MKRKVIQIAVAPDDCIYALCDDGTIWWTADYVPDGSWKQMEDVPQPPPPSDEELEARRKKGEERLEELRKKWEVQKRTPADPS